MAICKKCNQEKHEHFYKNDTTCKDCRRRTSRERHEQKSKDPDWIKKERQRQRDKYKRLGYKDKQKEWDKDKPWKRTSAYKNLSRDLKIPKGIAAHHWCYNDDKLRDVVLMDYSNHKQLHQLLELDLQRRIFKVKATGEYLDTRESHLKFILLSGFKYVEYSKDINYTILELHGE